jgi:hypothetical protein
MKQEYISERNSYTFESKLKEALAKGGRVTHMNTCLEIAEYQYSGGNQCKNIIYHNVFWALVQYDDDRDADRPPPEYRQ